MSDESFNVLYGWLENNLGNPYPSREIKEQIAKQAKISIFKLDKWLQNERAKLKRSKKKLAVSRSSVKNRFLEEFFVRNSNPTRQQKEELVFLTGKTYKQISNWFGSRRIKILKRF